MAIPSVAFSDGAARCARKTKVIEGVRYYGLTQGELNTEGICGDRPTLFAADLGIYCGSSGKLPPWTPPEWEMKECKWGQPSGSVMPASPASQPASPANRPASPASQPVCARKTKVIQGVRYYGLMPNELYTVGICGDRPALWAADLGLYCGSRGKLPPWTPPEWEMKECKWEQPSGSVMPASPASQPGQTPASAPAAPKKLVPVKPVGTDSPTVIGGKWD